ncbi:MAG: restriction endonuclease subunit S [Prevotella sp.]|jgi:type I restriction enzyme S subunit|nr:restriction endonuclease subunit S [Prevotella sp.]
MRRYEHYKDSGIEWIGEIPKYWDRCRIKYMLSRSVSGAWGNNPKGDNNDIVCFRVSDFDYEHGCLKFTNTTIRNIDSKQLEVRLLKKDDLIIEKSGGGNLWPVGRVIRVNSNQRATCSNFTYLISVQKNTSSNYLYYYFYCMYSRGANLLYFNQTTGIQNLKVSEYLGQEIYIPPLSEQKSIANYLDNKCGLIDRMIGNLQKKIELLKELKSSVISRIVTKGLDPHVKMRDSGIEWIGKIPEHWEICRLKSYCSVVLGKMLMTNKPKDKSTCYTKEYYLKSRNIGTLKLILENLDKMWFNSYEKKNYLLREGDIVINEGGDIGKVCLWKKQNYECYLQNSVQKITPNKNKIDSNYLQFLLFVISKSGYFWSIVSQISIAHLTKEKLSCTPILVPPLSEQQSIADYLDDKCEKIDSVVTKSQRKIDLLKEYKTALISEVVTGKRKVSA